jgi:hypothetical protein
MTSLKELRDRWKTDDGIRRRKEIINHLLNIATRGFVENKKVHTHAQIKGDIMDFPYTNETNQADLRGIDLEGERLPQIYIYNFDLAGANLRNANFGGTQFEGVDLRGVDLSNTNLSNVNIDQAKVGKYLSDEDCTNLSQADLRFAKFNNILYFDLKYGGYNLKEKEECKKAEGSYRVLRMFFKSQGDYENEDKCYRKEMIAKRKQKESKLKQFAEWLLLDATCGYGMKPKFVLAWILALIFIFGFFYSFFGSQFIYSRDLATHFSLGKALYFSTVTFSTLGFGDWHPNPDSYIKFLVAFEALLGFIFLTLWIVTLSRKIIRS